MGVTGYSKKDYLSKHCKIYIEFIVQRGHHLHCTYRTRLQQVVQKKYYLNVFIHFELELCNCI